MQVQMVKHSFLSQSNISFSWKSYKMKWKTGKEKLVIPSV